MAPTTMLMFYAGGGSTPKDLEEFIANGNGSGIFQALMDYILNGKISATSGGGVTFGETAEYKAVMSQFNPEPQYFSGINFSQFGLNTLGPGNPLIQLLIWPGNGDVGHTAIRINGTVYGYYPTDIDGDGAYTKTDLKNSPGENAYR